MIYLETIKKLLNIYFTNYPYIHYNCSNKNSNFGTIGISYELIYAQQTFWLANISLFIFIYNIKNTFYFYYYMYLFIWCIILYGISFKKVTNVIKYI